jgi:hypothetical protein
MFVALFGLVSSKDVAAPSPTLIKGFTETWTFGINLPSLLAVSVGMFFIMTLVYYCERRSSTKAQRVRPDDSVPPVLDQFEPAPRQHRGQPRRNGIELETLDDPLGQPQAMFVPLVAPTPYWGVPAPSGLPPQGPGIQYGFYQHGPNRH